MDGLPISQASLFRASTRSCEERTVASDEFAWLSRIQALSSSLCFRAAPAISQRRSLYIVRPLRRIARRSFREKFRSAVPFCPESIASVGYKCSPREKVLRVGFCDLSEARAHRCFPGFSGKTVLACGPFSPSSSIKRSSEPTCRASKPPFRTLLRWK